jgi:TIGR03009 family protein
VRKWQAKPATSDQPPGQIQGDWVLQKDAISEHWVCDGKSVFEYRQDQKQLVERPIPVQMQGQAIVDGPLPFLFGAETAKLKARYWLRVVDQPNQNEIWLEVLPRYQADAANYTKVEVILDQQQVLPKAMQVHLPGQSRQVYKFDLANASINSPLARLEAMFQRPRTPLGWKRVVEEIPPQQAAQPDQPPR